MNTEEEGRRDVVGSSAQPETVSATDEVFYSNEDQQQDFAKRRASRTSKTVLPHSRLPPINAANRNSINESSIRRKSAFLETPGTSLSEYSTSSPLLSAIQRDEDGDADESQSSLDEKPTFQRKRASSAQISNSVLPPILPHVSTVSERSSTSPTTGNGGGVGSQPKPSRRASIIDGRRLSSAIRRIFSVPPLTSAVPVVDEKGFLREIGMRKILIWSQLDVRLFDRVLEFKSKNADTSKELAFITFGSLNSSSDAVINMIYDDYTPDYILKYDVRSIHQNTRDAFERELLRLGFFIELETSKDIEFHLYVKIVAPFRVLCAAAEVYNLRRPLREPAVLIPISMIDQINKKSRFLQFLNFVDERIDLNLQTATFKAEELKSFRGTEDNIPDHKIMQTFFKPFYR